MYLTAFLAPDEIPFQLVSEGAAGLGPPLADRFAASPDPSLELLGCLEPLERFSLVTVNREDRSYAMHRLVQQVLRHSLDCEDQRRWAQRAIGALEVAFGQVRDDRYETFYHVAPDRMEIARRFLPHAVVAERWIENYGLRSEEVLHLIARVGSALGEQGDLAARTRFTQLGVRLARDVHGERHADYVVLLSCLGECYYAAEAYGEAERNLSRAVEIARELGKQGKPLLPDLLLRLASFYIDMGLVDWDDPRGFLATAKKVRSLLEESLGSSPTERGGRSSDLRATALLKLGSLYTQMGRAHGDLGNRREADRLYGLAESILDRSPEVVEWTTREASVIAAQIMTERGILHANRDRFEEAKRCLLESLRLHTKSYGPCHFDTAVNLSDLASLFVEWGEERTSQREPQKARACYQEAVEYFRRALPIIEKTRGARHRNYAFVLGGLWRVLKALGNDRSCMEIVEQAKRLYRDDDPGNAKSYQVFCSQIHVPQHAASILAGVWSKNTLPPRNLFTILPQWPEFGSLGPQPSGERATTSQGRNDPCPCGSGKKYKHCHGRTQGN